MESIIFGLRFCSLRFLLTVSSCSIASVFLWADNDAQAAEPTSRVLKYSDHESLGRMRTNFIKDVFFPAIEKESKGRLKINAHWDSKVAINYDALGAIGKPGILEMGMVVPEFTADLLPLHQIFKSFPVGPAGSKQVDFFRRVYAEVPAFPDELKKNGIVPIFLATGYPLAFFSTKTLDNLSNLKGGKLHGQWHDGGKASHEAGDAPLHQVLSLIG